MLNNKSFSGVLLVLLLSTVLPNFVFGQVHYLRGDSGFVAGSVIALEDELYTDFSGLRSNVSIQPQVQLKYDEIVVVILGDSPQLEKPCKRLFSLVL